MISVVIPVLNEEENIEELHRKTKEKLVQLGEPYEIIFVDDGSTDNTFTKLKQLKPIKIVKLQKNFGQTSAMDAGFSAAEGEIVVTMDGDLQNDPEDIPVLVKKIREGYDVVSGWRKNRQDSIGRKLLSYWGNKITYKVTGLYLHDYACAIKAYRKEILKDVHLYGEMHVFLPAYLYGRGAKVTEIPVNHHGRKSGVSKHTFMKAVKDISDLLTIRFLSQYMARPLLFFGSIALVFLGFGFASAILATILKIWGIRNYGQTPLPILTVLFIIIGFLIFMMGFLAELMIRIYCESQKKLPYIVKEIVENKA